VTNCNNPLAKSEWQNGPRQENMKNEPIPNATKKKTKLGLLFNKKV
jgi:hypothetical protein